MAIITVIVHGMEKTYGLLPTLLLVLFIAKLTGVIAWSWRRVLAPLWIPIACAVPFVIVFLLLALISGAKARRA